MIAPAEIIELEVEHRTSEDWLWRLPLQLGPDTAASAAALTGAAAQCRLAGKTTQQEPSEILFAGASCRIEGHEIVLEAASTLFQDKAGAYRGDVLVRLASGFKFVSHVIELDLKHGLGWTA